MGKGLEIDVVSIPDSQGYFLQLTCMNHFRNAPARHFNLRVGTPGHVRIPKSQCIIAATLFFGLLMSYSIRYETPDPGTEVDEEEEDSRAAWELELNNSSSSSPSASYFSVYTDYEVTGIRGDESSLFRAIVHGYCIEHASPMPSDRSRLALVVDLRSMTVDMLESRQNWVKKFIEGDFDEYLDDMAYEYAFGGEVEILMACHIVMSPIRVFRYVRALGGLKLLAEYGRMYHRKRSPVDILYKGDSRYDAFDVPGMKRLVGRIPSRIRSM